MEIFEIIFFYILSLIVIVGAVSAILSKKIISSVIFSLAVFMGISGFYFLMNATFNAVAQIFIFSAVIILLIFATVLTGEKNKNSEEHGFKPRILVSALSLLCVFLTLVWAIVDDYLVHVLDIMSGSFALNRSLSTVYVIGEKLLTDYIVVFEIVSMMIFILVIGLAMVCVLRRNEEGK